MREVRCFGRKGVGFGGRCCVCDESFGNSGAGLGASGWWWRDGGRGRRVRLGEGDVGIEEAGVNARGLTGTDVETCAVQTADNGVGIELPVFQ